MSGTHKEILRFRKKAINVACQHFANLLQTAAALEKYDSAGLQIIKDSLLTGMQSKFSEPIMHGVVSVARKSDQMPKEYEY